MADNVHQLRLRPNDSEKVTINLGSVDLGHIDLMVRRAFTRTEQISFGPAIRNQLERHAEVVKQSTARKSWILVCGTTAATISKRRVAPERCSRSMY